MDVDSRTEMGWNALQTFDLADVLEVCERHRIEPGDLRPGTGSFDKRLFFINDELLLRVSATPMEREQERFRRVAALPWVPQLKHVGVLDRRDGPAYYTVVTALPGVDLVTGHAETTVAQQTQVGRDLAGFLDSLHAYVGPSYDIGLYVPALPGFAGTWRAGHQRYWELLEHGTASLQLQPDSRSILGKAFAFLRSRAGTLDHQSGPALLHNDLHPRNILLHQGGLSGVIDWECAQHGEPDFDLCHVVHWCLYPPDPGLDLRAFLRGLLRAAPRCTRVPELAGRLTLYQVEHEIQQIIWQGNGAEAERVPRIVRWMEGAVDDLWRDVG